MNLKQFNFKSMGVLLIVHIVLIFGVVVLDIGTKLHAEKELMTSYSQADMRIYRANTVHVFAIGNSPESLIAREDENSEPSKNWVEFNLTYLRNPGVAWGAFSNMPNWFRLPFMHIASLIATILLASWYVTAKKEQVFFKTALVLAVAGAIGNTIDRVRLWYVIDFFQVNWRILGWEYYFPVFNIADSAVSIGFTMLLFFILKDEVSLYLEKKAGNKGV